MNTNKPKLKTQRKKGLNIQLDSTSQTLTMNVAHDISILEYWICIYSLAEGVFKKCFLESKTLPSINRYPICKEKNFFGKKTKTKKKKQNKTQFSMVKSQLMVYQNEQLL